ncbi:MAG: NIPSNAP family protein [Burkholderiaceae bacterium]
MPNTTEHHCSVIELRQYTLRPGERDSLIALFDQEFVETQEAVGMRVLGQFRDLDDADRFVWLRGFKSMAARAEALAAFYGGPVWQAHRHAANATMLDSDNVVLLRPASATTPMPIETWQRGAAPAGALLALVCQLSTAPDARFVAAFMHTWLPLLARHRGTLAGCCVTEPAANTFPSLPVREGEQVLVALARFDAPEGCTRVAAELKASHEWLDHIGTPDGTRLVAPPQVLRLAPTARSRF